MDIVAAGVNHRTAPVEARERLAFSPRQIPLALQELRAVCGARGCVLLQTCNRTEVYASVPAEEEGPER